MSHGRQRRRPVEEPTANAPNSEQLGHVAAGAPVRQHLEVEAASGMRSRSWRRRAPLADALRPSRRRVARLEDELPPPGPRRRAGVEQAVDDHDGACGERRVGRRPRHASRSRGRSADSERDQRDQTARPISSSVENRKRGTGPVRGTRAGRRAGVGAFALRRASAAPAPIGVRAPASPRLPRRLPSVRSSAAPSRRGRGVPRRPGGRRVDEHCSSDGSATSKWVTRAPACEAAARTSPARARRRARPSSGPCPAWIIRVPGRRPATAGDGRPRRETGPSAARSRVGPRGSGRRPRRGRGRRSRPTRTAPRRPPSGGSRRRSSARGRAAPGTPRAAAHVDRVEARERLVHEQDLGVVQDGGDELDLLLVALRQLLGAAVGVVRGAEAAQPVQRAAPGAVGRDAVQAGEEQELLEDPHPRVQAALLGQVAPGPSAAGGGCRRRRQVTRPASGSRTPSAIRIVVVLPAPFAPRNPNTWPCGTSNARSSRATTLPKRLNR